MKLLRKLWISLACVAFGLAAHEYVIEASPTPPPPPRGAALLNVTAEQDQIDVVWDDQSSYETGFKIERSLDAESGWDEIALVSADVTEFTDTSTTLTGQMYYYRVCAFSDGGDSNYSNILGDQLP